MCPRPRLLVARFPGPGQTWNPCLELLYDGLSQFGLELAADPELTLSWLWRHRQTVGCLHFNWRPDRYYACLPSTRDARAGRRPTHQAARSWLRLAVFAGRLVTARLLGYQVAWTIHSVYPPETLVRPPGTISRRLDRYGGAILARSSHVLLAHDRATADQARANLGRSVRSVEIVAHGSYIGVYPPGRPRAAVRAALGIASNAFAFLCFGSLRREKSLDLVLEAFRSIPDPSVVLVIAGRVEDEVAVQSVKEAARLDLRIKPLLELVPPAEVAELFAAVDAAVVARDRALTSGSLILALSLGVPVVASRLPPYEELLAGDAAGWLFEPGDVSSLRHALRNAALEPARARAKGIVARRQAERLPSWSNIAACFAALMTANLRHERSPADGRRAG